MRFDITNIVLEIILSATAIFWWMSRTPNTTQNCKRKQNWYLLWPGFGPVFAPVNYPLESLLVNIASLSGTVLSDVLRPSQAIFSVLLVLHDAWPLLFTLVSSSSSSSSTTPSFQHSSSSSSTSSTNADNISLIAASTSSNGANGATPIAKDNIAPSSSASPTYDKIPNRKNWIRLIYISVICMLIYFFLYLVLGDRVIAGATEDENSNKMVEKSTFGIGSFILHYGAVISGYFAGFGALLVAARHTADYTNHAAYQDKILSKIEKSNTNKQNQRRGGTTENKNGNVVDDDDVDEQQINSSPSSSSSPSPFRSPPQHDVLDGSAAAASSSNALQHTAMVATYFVYGIMLLVDFATMWESGPWLLYVSGSVFIEVVKHFWTFRVKSLNVDTVV